MIRNDATEKQVRAANPANSTWLSANAGSGKTRVLTDRVARLLLDDVDPLHILCLTYTKAAASEMQNRLFDRLGKWAMMPDAELLGELAELGATSNDLDHARTLFARAIETPGGLRIQTIHSFCAGLLRRFPLEAKISPQFKEMEDQQAAQLRSEIVDQMSIEAPALVAGIAGHVSDEGLDRLLQAIANKRDFFTGNTTDNDLRRIYELGPKTGLADVISGAIESADKATADAVKEAFCGQSKTYTGFAQRLTALPFDAPDLSTYHALCKEFLYQSGDKFGQSKSVNFPQSNHTKAVEALGDATQSLHDWMDRVEQAHNLERSLKAFARTRALYAFATSFIARYEAAKLARGLLDFDDLIRNARTLLGKSDVAQWVLFRLDGGIDHILVDEAQDTSPIQWEVISSLAQEFSAGIGAGDDRARTIFVVGDKKQSIYSFQGADPAGFDKMRDHFDTGLGHVGQALNTLELEHSFRSSSAILNAVDTVFRGEHTDFEWDDTPHRAFKSDMPGRVDIWPVLEQTEDPKDEFDWTAPIDTVSEQDVNVRLAQMIACEIKRMIREDTIPVENGHTGTYNHRPITEGDVLILVQRRSDLFGEIIRACKAAKLNIAGADRLKVGAELAVKDITSLLRFLALAEDDLSLAEALRSPLFGWSEQDLYSLAQSRAKGVYLWTALRNSDAHPQTREILDDLRKQSDFMRPYDLINRLLTRHDGRRRLLARLGSEAEDGIDALLSQALGYESSAIPGLTGFLEWMQAGDLEIKRQLDSAEDRIRVMTVHGAKGLEAPIVFLPDTGKRKQPSADLLLDADDMLHWSTKSADTPHKMQTLKDARRTKQEEERRRLLYVAMTRAESWLIVCGVEVKNNKDAYSWHDMIAAGLNHLGQTDTTFPSGPGKRYGTGDWNSGTHQETQAPKAAVIAAQSDFPILPQHDIAAETKSPSDLGGPKALPGETDETRADEAMDRGTFIHLLLEHLPGISPDKQLETATALAQSSQAAGLSGISEMIADTLGLLAAPHLADIFAPHSLSEVEITADLPHLGRLHGAIDRLIVDGDTVTAIDYKSNRIVPTTPQETPEGLLRQMGAYHAMLERVWPNHEIKTAILWTATATLMPMPAPLISNALTRAT